MTTKVPAALLDTDVSTTYVTASGDQTIAGTKTFSTQPVLPQKLTQATAQNTTSGTSIDFTAIPTWVKRITVMLNGVSTNGTSNVQIQIGAGSVTTSGYLGANVTYNAGTTGTNLSAGFLIDGAGAAAASVRHGVVTIANITGNTWVASGAIGLSNTGGGAYVGGMLALSGTLDRVRLTTVNGTDAFDAGSVNIIYE